MTQQLNIYIQHRVKSQRVYMESHSTVVISLIYTLIELSLNVECIFLHWASYKLGAVLKQVSKDSPHM